MRVEDVMTGEAVSCRAQDDLGHVAKLLWDRDCGAVPVVDGADRVVGMITDRDVCMAAFTRAVPLSGLRVEHHMSRPARTCSVGDALEDAAKCMGDLQVRRLPILDETGALCGILSINDVVRAATTTKARRLSKLVLEVLARIGRPRLEPESTLEVVPSPKRPAPAGRTAKEPVGKATPATAKKRTKRSK